MMEGVFVVDYVNENEFTKLERSLKKYNRLAYKKLNLEVYPELKIGNFLGELVDETSNRYQLKLPTDSMFAKVHGDIRIYYYIDYNENKIYLETIMPKDILTEGHQSELVAYKGVMVSKQHSEKDMFKINLLNMIGK